jgi:small nuclear ribonucleoprotein (snRNP)-like protein
MRYFLDYSMRNTSLRSNLAFALKNDINKEVMLKVRIYKVYIKGILAAFDQYSNILLKNATEYFKDAEGNFNEKGKYPGSVLVRGDSIVNISIVD